MRLWGIESAYQPQFPFNRSALTARAVAAAVSVASAHGIKYALLPEFADWLEPAQAMLNALRDAVTT